jgi:YVTN family beta-propeller protein
MNLTFRLAAIGCALTLAGCAAGGQAGTHGPTTHPSTRTPAPGRSAAAVRAATITRTIRISSAVGSPDGMAIGAGSLWVGGYDGDAVAQLDPVSGKAIRTITVGANPLGVAVIDGSVWAADYGSGQVSRIDPATGKVTATITVGSAPDSFATIGRQLWVFDQGSSAATVLDPVSAKVLRTVPLPVQSGFASTGAGKVWVPDLAGTKRIVIGLDPATGKVAVTVHVGKFPSEVAFGFGSGWVTCEDAVYRFDPATGVVRKIISAPGAGFDGIAISGGAVWVGDLNNGLIDRISPARNAITGSVSTGGGPRHVVAVGGDLWVALFDAAAVVQLHPAN